MNGTVDGTRVRVTLSRGGAGWAFTLSPSRVLGLAVAPGDEVSVELTPEGPQRADLAEDVAAALAANPAAGAFFDTLAQFYRKAYLRWIDGTTRRPEVRAARIAEVVELLAASVKQRPRSPAGRAGGGGVPWPSCALRAASSLSTSLDEVTSSSSFWMSSPPPPTSSSTPDWSSSSSAPARACIVAILSWARSSAAPGVADAG